MYVQLAAELPEQYLSAYYERVLRLLPAWHCSWWSEGLDYALYGRGAY